MADRYITETYSDGRTNTRTALPDISSEVGSLAGGAIAAGVAAVLALGLGASALDAKAEAKHYAVVNAAAVAYERNPSTFTQQKLIDSLKYLTGAKVRVFGWGSLSELLKYMCLGILMVVPIFGLIYVIHLLIKQSKSIKERRKNALKIAENYGLGNIISRYMYSIVDRISIGVIVSIIILSVLLALVKTM